MAYRTCAFAATHIVKWHFHRFSPFERFCSRYLASRMDKGSSSCDGGSERHSFFQEAARRIAPIGRKTGSARTRSLSVPIHNLPAMSTTSDFSSFGRRSSAFRQPRQMLFTWPPMTAVKTLSKQARTAGYLGFQSDELQRERSVLPYTKRPEHGQNSSSASLV